DPGGCLGQVQTALDQVPGDPVFGLHPPLLSDVDGRQGLVAGTLSLQGGGQVTEGVGVEPQRAEHGPEKDGDSEGDASEGEDGSEGWQAAHEKTSGADRKRPGRAFRRVSRKRAAGDGPDDRQEGRWRSGSATAPADRSAGALLPQCPTIIGPGQPGSNRGLHIFREGREPDAAGGKKGWSGHSGSRASLAGAPPFWAASPGFRARLGSL